MLFSRLLILLTIIFFSFFIYAEKGIEEIISHRNDLYFIDSLKKEDIILLNQQYKDTKINVFQR